LKWTFWILLKCYAEGQKDCHQIPLAINDYTPIEELEVIPSMDQKKGKVAELM
jgi:hypothetical protein